MTGALHADAYLRCSTLFVVPSNGPIISQKRQDCAIDALHKNWVSLGLDVVGKFVPGGGALGVFAKTAFGVGSIAHSALSGDSSATGMVGIGASFVGLQANAPRAAASCALRGTEMGLARTLAKSLPGVGQLANGLAAGADAYTAYKDYNACMAKEKGRELQLFCICMTMATG